jgi:hypothetical protein
VGGSGLESRERVGPQREKFRRWSFIDELPVQLLEVHVSSGLSPAFPGVSTRPTLGRYKRIGYGSYVRSHA